MRTINLVLLLTIAGSALADAQVQAPPQTARQAVLEMLLAKSPDAFERHLPEAVRNSLFRDRDAPQTPFMRELTSFRSGIARSNGQLETFDSGSTLLTIDENEAHHKVEIIVERDDLEGGADEIELSFHSYIDGRPEPLPVRPRIVLSMEQEKEVWKLDEVTVALHVPLSDPDFLKDLQRNQNPALESTAIANLRTLLTAEISYGAAFPERGFTCTLSELGGSGLQDAPSQQHAMLIDDTLASGRHNGYIFSIRGCGVAPASRLRLTAVPSDTGSDLRAFCSDESAVLRYATDGKAATCLSEGAPLE